MQLVLATRSLAVPGGSEWYLITVAQQLERLGHGTHIYALELGDMAEEARRRGIVASSSTRELPQEADGVLVQDGVTAYELSELYPDTPRVFVAHSHFLDLQRPPQLADVCAAVVVLNDRVGGRLEHLASCPELVRLRQPVDLARFLPYGGARPKPISALVLGHVVGGARYEMIASVCERRGIAVKNVGRHGRATFTPELELARADVVIGTGRSAIEAMVCSKAAYVYGPAGGDGWVTPDSYPALEADGFAGTATDAAIHAARFDEELGQYHGDMGRLNRDLAVRNHDADVHAGELVALFRRLQPARPRHPAPLRELARLVHIQWQTETRAITLSVESQGLRKEVRRLESERDYFVRELERCRENFQTRRYRLAQAIARPLDLLRALGGRRRR